MSGFVLEARLAAAPRGTRVGDFEEAIRPGNVVGADASVGDLLDWIVEPGLLFVLDGREITGFVTVSDFNKQPARAYLYLLLATLEIGLAELLRASFAGRQDDVVGILRPQQAGAVRKKYRDDVRDNTEADLIAYLTFGHLLQIAVVEPGVRLALGASADQLDEARHDLIETRNQVMHPTRSLVTRKDSLIRLRTRERLLRGVVSRLQAYIPVP